MDEETFFSIMQSVPIGSHIKRYQRMRILDRVEQVLDLQGDIAECGVCQGGTAGLIMELLRRKGSDKAVHLFDVFDKFPDLRTEEEHKEQDKTRGDIKRAHPHYLEEVEESLKKCGFTNYEVHKGLFSDTFPKFHTPLCLIHGDSDLYQSMLETCGLVKRLLVKGGYFIVHDWKEPRWSGVEKAINDGLNLDYYNITECGHQLILERK